LARALSPSLSPSPSQAPRRTATVTATASPTRPPAVPALLSIPKLKIERDIVPLGRVTRDGQSDWDTDKLFATSKRPDLVGHMKGTGSPGRSGNVVLAGHNYNRGRFNWHGVFYNLKRLEEGDVIYITSQENERFAYRVVQVEEVNWPPRTAADMRKHIDHHSATPDETLTLVTCGGANLAPFPARVYVTAKRIREPGSVTPDIPTATATLEATATSKPQAKATNTQNPPGAGQPNAPGLTPPVDSCRTTVTVRRGETLAMIARQYGVSVASIVRRNGIKNPDRIYVGWRLCIP